MLREPGLYAPSLGHPEAAEMETVVAFGMVLQEVRLMNWWLVGRLEQQTSLLYRQLKPRVDLVSATVMRGSFSIGRQVPHYT